MNTPTVKMTPVREEFQQYVEKMGIRDIKPFWNPEWKAKIQSMPDSPERDIEIDKGIRALLDSMYAIDSRKYEVIDLAKDATPIDPKVQAIINNVNIE